MGVKGVVKSATPLTTKFVITVAYDLVKLLATPLSSTSSRSVG